MRDAPGLEVLQIGPVCPQRAGRVREGLIGLGFRHRQGGARWWRLLAFGQAGQLAGAGSAEGVHHGLMEARMVTRGKGYYRVLTPSPGRLPLPPALLATRPAARVVSKNRPTSSRLRPVPIGQQTFSTVTSRKNARPSGVRGIDSATRCRGWSAANCRAVRLFQSSNWW